MNLICQIVRDGSWEREELESRTGGGRRRRNQRQRQTSSQCRNGSEFTIQMILSFSLPVTISLQRLSLNRACKRRTDQAHCSPTTRGLGFLGLRPLGRTPGAPSWAVSLRQPTQILQVLSFFIVSLSLLALDPISYLKKTVFCQYMYSCTQLSNNMLCLVLSKYMWSCVNSCY